MRTSMNFIKISVVTASTWHLVTLVLFFKHVGILNMILKLNQQKISWRAISHSRCFQLHLSELLFPAMVWCTHLRAPWRINLCYIIKTNLTSDRRQSRLVESNTCKQVKPVESRTAALRGPRQGPASINSLSKGRDWSQCKHKWQQ